MKDEKNFFNDPQSNSDELALGIVNETPRQTQAKISRVNKRFNFLANDKSTKLTKFKNETLESAVRVRDVNEVKKCLEEYNINPNGKYYLNQSLLHFIARQNSGNIEASYQIAKLLIEKGADLKATDKNGNTSLHAAVFCGNAIIAKFLIEKGADVNAVNLNNETVTDVATDELKKAIAANSKEEWKTIIDVQRNRPEPQKTCSTKYGFMM